MSAHLSYLKRDGVTRNSEKAGMFDAGSDRADDMAFAERSKDDRHHFRFIVSPEDAGEMTDLRAFTRDLAKQMEACERPASGSTGRRRRTAANPH